MRTAIDELNLNYFNKHAPKVRQEGREEGREEGLVEGREEGEDNKTLQVTIRMLKSGNFSLDVIADTVEKDLAYVMGVKERIVRGVL